MHDSVIFARNVTKYIGNCLIIDHITLKIYPKDIYGLLGINGAGKTTFLRLMTGLIAPTEGEILIQGINIEKNRKKALLKMGAIVESPVFFPFMSGRKNLQNLARLNPSMSGKEQLEKVEEVLEIVGLSNRGDDKVKTYSLGMKQRLGIAQALLNNPDLIILDEPFNGLDPIGKKELRDLIVKLQNEKNITFFISSHLLDELRYLCNKFMIIHQGKMIWQGDKETLLSTTNTGNDLEEAFIQLIQNYH
ncbi:ABC transporter ATP-binding protein [Thermotalea metallivorans]|uniref:Putative ABC transporter ATP-binding protein YbhF n=1 Tax=Thermotalea metallivorans TaxID=520762 RepID=A0A140L6X4_9FIRM|nr:ATP-binding cassette domain-containing protein [Thermotalea metallivorans]KXG76299.1 putative ABC transporter ATP-binding protein YbhF [Thermotalea metallivorans]